MQTSLVTVAWLRIAVEWRTFRHFEQTTAYPFLTACFCHWHCGMWVSGHAGDGLVVRLDELSDLFQPLWFHCYFIISFPSSFLFSYMYFQHVLDIGHSSFFSHMCPVCFLHRHQITQVWDGNCCCLYRQNPFSWNYFKWGTAVSEIYGYLKCKIPRSFAKFFLPVLQEMENNEKGSSHHLHQVAAAEKPCSRGRFHCGNLRPAEVMHAYAEQTWQSEQPVP